MGCFGFFLNFFKQLCLGVHCNNSKFTYLKLMDILFKILGILRFQTNFFFSNRMKMLSECFYLPLPTAHTHPTNLTRLISALIKHTYQTRAHIQTMTGRPAGSTRVRSPFNIIYFVQRKHFLLKNSHVHNELVSLQILIELKDEKERLTQLMTMDHKLSQIQRMTDTMRRPDQRYPPKISP